MRVQKNCEKRLSASSRLSECVFCLYVFLSVCPSVRIEQLHVHWTDFHEVWYMKFRKSAEKIQGSLKFYENRGYFIWSPIEVYDNIPLNSS